MPLFLPPPPLRLPLAVERFPLPAASGQRAVLMALAQLVAPLRELEKNERAAPHLRLVAITHGDPTDPTECGRPITYRKTAENEKRSADLVAVCPVHGDLVDPNTRTGDGYTGLFAFRGLDMRPRRKLE